MKGGKSGFGHWNFMKGKGKQGKGGFKGNFKGSGKGKGKDKGFSKGTSGKSFTVVCWTCGQTGHTSRECPQQYRVSGLVKLQKIGLLRRNIWVKVIPGKTSVMPGTPHGMRFRHGELVSLMTSVGILALGMMVVGGLQKTPGPTATTSRPQLQRPKQIRATLPTRPQVSAVLIGEPPGLSLPERSSKAKASAKPKASTASGLLLAAVTLNSVTSGASFEFAPVLPMLAAKISPRKSAPVTQISAATRSCPQDLLCHFVKFLSA